ncbi:MAG: hypothetical protein IJT69_01415, partial [Clostridia bacterium]|nr:hypothetical protein [Clostridia bacterium]
AAIAVNDFYRFNDDQRRRAEQAKREERRAKREEERKRRAEEREKRAQTEGAETQTNKGASALSKLKSLSGNRASATEAFRPDTVTTGNPPSLKPLDADDPSEAENPTSNPFGIRRRNNNGEDNN